LEKLLTIASPRQLALPFGILTIIVLMVVPIPAFMLDVFFVFNIALSVAVLMASMNAEKPLDFSSFPTVLLCHLAASGAQRGINPRRSGPWPRRAGGSGPCDRGFW
jgi:flagellar biosynthesis component FlhA